ncbi:GTP-dependent nucleic acid-binding protein EngD [Gottschalkia acidurici 9a]|uniref:Ribosome-binding ATPase YchF n=1 Tax=Gottschalkia acidurici (strain ATCC 7906 / DSM 604 / BCRC 14475 / CIP 104303 / KCTC 5404 / NCIMB 10678 / 9a) TaxID=1128398 RepID=K0AYF5_GOTA9|nr:redox-regulated ATPase YchF [Gottschalkia acidurici]AFS78294.1 GTP-dependent nucleic acid-binding protein EngD [Gottschalkia acidurici 9a]
MKLGIVGLPNVGKSTLFNAITSAGAESANYPFCTIEPNVGVVSVPDERLEGLRLLFDSEKCVPTAIEFFDIAGLVKGASKGEGLGNKFLSHIREVEAIVHVVRCFEDENITHVEGRISPIEDIEIINLELILADLEVVTKRIERAQKLLKSDKSLQKEVDLLIKIKGTLEDGNSVRSLEFDDDEVTIVKSFNLLSNKPILYVTNISEEDVISNPENEYVKEVQEYASKEHSQAVIISAQIEAEVSELDDEEKKAFLNDLGLKESGLDKLIKASYKLLGLMSYLTAGPKEVRAWTIKIGTKAPQAAGKIHTDMERGFIRAEVINYGDLIECGGYPKAKEKGLVRLEGKDYVMQDGDVVVFRFNV